MQVFDEAVEDLFVPAAKSPVIIQNDVGDTLTYGLDGLLRRTRLSVISSSRESYDRCGHIMHTYTFSIGRPYQWIGCWNRVVRHVGHVENEGIARISVY